MPRTRPENVTPRAEPPPAEKPDRAAPIGPGWAIFFSVWGVMFGLLLVYELWGLFAALLRHRPQ